MSKKLLIKTYGCQMNVYDSARMADVLAPHGYVRTDDPEDADLVLLNTCHIREKAADKVFSELGRLAALKGRGRKVTIGVAGCVAQAEGKEIAARAPAVDIVVGPQAYHRLPALVDAARAEGARKGAVLDTDFPAESKFDHLPGESAPRGPSAFLTIQEGCDKFCAFCVVPYTRGAEASRPMAAVEAEARRLVEGGVREITLLGQNVNAYRDGAHGLGALLARLARIEGVDRLRYTTSHPRDVDAAQIAAHRDIPAVMPFLHLPVQSGSDRILAAMNRKHGAADYLRTVERLRAGRSDLALSSDFIVGFPGETEADFEATMGLVRAVGYAQAYSFKYSARPGTPAADASDPVPEDVKADRLARLQALILSQQRAYNARAMGGVVQVLFDRPGGRPGQLSGRTPHMQSVHAEAPAALMGQIVPVRVRAAGVSLTGRAVATPMDLAPARRIPASHVPTSHVQDPVLERSAD